MDKEITEADMEAIDKAFDKAEKIGVIGSPSSTIGLTIDVLGTAVDKRLVGTLCVFKYTQEAKDHFSLGQITEINLKNVWSEDPTMRGLIRQKGRVDPITERQDTHTASMMVSSVFGKNATGFEPSILGTVPSTGNPIKLINDDIMKGLLVKYLDQLFYLGKAYGSNILMPMWFKHFGQGEEGVGEAYHIGIFGKTGSGKSVLAKMVITGYAKHPSMSIFIIDPQGEFSKELGRESPLRNHITGKLKKGIEMVDLQNLVITGNIDLFTKLLVYSGFHDNLGVYHEDNKVRANNVIRDAIKKERFKPWDLHKRASFDKVWASIGTAIEGKRIYTSGDPLQRLTDSYESADKDDYYELWKHTANLFKFEGRKVQGIQIKDLVGKIITAEEKKDSGKITVINLSETEVPDDILWNDDVKSIVIKELIDELTKQAEAVYKKGKSLNTLVVIDEAHRLAPRERTDNEDLEEIKSSLIDAVRTTRKFGLGWMFISQTLSSLDRGITEQIRAYIFGFGLGWGLELVALRELIGGNDDAIKLYQSFKDPQSNFGDKQYPFMMVGPLSPLAFSSIPLFFTASKYPEEFLALNAAPESK